MSVKDKYKIERNYVTNVLARSRQKINKVKFLVSHETANENANADAHYIYFQNILMSASAHTFIDDKKILEIIPLNEKAWHVMYQKDKKSLGLGAANDNAIGIELCRPGNFKAAYDRYVWYHAYLCKQYGLQPRKNITAHKFEDPQRRTDPQSWLIPNGVTWNQFINDVQNYYDNWESNKGVELEKSETTVKENAAYSSNNKPTAKTEGIVDWMVANKMDSSYSNRAKLAAQYGIKNYTGSAKQNNDLLTKLKAGNKPVSKPVEKLVAKTGSIVDYMKSKGMDSGFANRKKLATQYGIKNYTGTATQNNTLLNKLKGGAVVSKPKGDQKTKSVVDYLKSIGQDSSYANRSKLAAKHGIKNYKGTGKQNEQLLNKLRK